MKKRNRIIYANQGLFAGPAFKDGVSYSENILSPNLSKVKSIAYSAQINRQQFNTLGKDSPASDQHSTHPEVTLDISYGSASATNEKLLGLTYDSTNNSFIKNLVDVTDDDNYAKNFYLVTAKEGIDFVSGDAQDMESVLFFSNCYLNSYGYEIEVKSPPAVTANFVGENMGYFQASDIPFQDLKIPILNKKTAFEESYAEVTIPQGKKVDEQMLIPSEASISITKASDSAANNLPDKIRGLSMWLDASDFSSSTDNDLITNWTDKMGNVTFTNTGDVKYRSTIDGLPHCLEMDAASEMTSTSTLDDIISSKGYTVFIVNRPASTITTTACGGGTVIGSNTWGHRTRKSTGGVYYDQFYNAGAGDASDCPLAATRMNNVNLIMSSFDGTTSDICLKKIGPSYTDENCDYMSKPLSEITDLTSTLRLGADGYSGYIAEVIIYRRHLKDSEKAKVQKYLWNKYSWTLPMDFETETSIVNFENEKLQSLKFNLNLDREEESIIGHRIPLDRKIKFPVPVTSTLAFLADNTEEGSLATFLSNDETYDVSTSFTRSGNDLSLYVSDFSSSKDGWDMTGGNLTWSNYNDPANDPEPDDYLQCNCDTTSDYHEAWLSPTLAAGKKYRLTGDIWLGTSVPNIESLVLRVNDGVGNNAVHFTVTSSMAGVWRPFSVEFTVGAAVAGAIKVTAVDSNDNMQFGAATTDVFYLQDFKLTEIERSQEILNIDFKGAKLKSLSHNSEIGGNKQINLEINTFIHDTNEEAGFGFSGIYSS